MGRLKKKIIATLMILASSAVIVGLIIMKYKSEGVIPADEIIIGAALLLLQLGLGWTLFKSA